MSSYQDVFKRYEQKYRLSALQHRRLMQALARHMEPDQYGIHTIANIYFDTADYSLIRHSIEKPLYKEKLRLRRYGTPGPEDGVFLELKKKYDGIVYKRRVQVSLADAGRFVTPGQTAGHRDQILKEIGWFVERYRPEPKVFIAYERQALMGLEDPSLRLTFDTGLRWRETLLDLAKGHWGTPLLPAGEVLMELKAAGAMPLWLSRTLGSLGVYPASFSKYGQCYREHLVHPKHPQGGIHCA